MRAQHALTQRFTAEFSLRPYLQHHRDATLRHLRAWAQDDNAHVRRAAKTCGVNDVIDDLRPFDPWQPPGSDALARELAARHDQAGFVRAAPFLGLRIPASLATPRVPLGLIEAVKARNPDALYVCDPVIGDDDTIQRTLERAIYHSSFGSASFIDVRGRTLMPGLIDCHWHATLVSVTL